MLKNFLWSRLNLPSSLSCLDKLPRSQGKLRIISLLFVITLTLTACKQPVEVGENSNAISDKAVVYLRSQLQLPANSTITLKSQSAQTWYQGDLCQITAPTQTGFQVILTANNTRYTLHTNQDASKIEICTAQDETAPATAKYIGAGYTVRYPIEWQVIDEGLKPSGESSVRFTPPNQNEQPQQGYVLIRRVPSPTSESLVLPTKSPTTTNLDIKEFKTEPYNVAKLGAKSGIKQTYTQILTDASGNKKNWQVKDLLIRTDEFIYEIQSFQPAANTPTDMVFEHFMNSFQFIK